MCLISSETPRGRLKHLRLNSRARHPRTRLLPAPPPLPLLSSCKELLLLLVYHTLKLRGTNYPPARGRRAQSPRGRSLHDHPACCLLSTGLRCSSGRGAVVGGVRSFRLSFRVPEAGSWKEPEGWVLASGCEARGNAGPGIRNGNAVQNQSSQHLSNL